MGKLPDLSKHRVATRNNDDVLLGEVRFSPVKASWFVVMLAGAVVGGLLTLSWSAFALFIVSTGTVLLLGHSLGSHRKFIHNSYQCPKWLEYTFVYLGVQVGLAGPLGLMRQHELRDYAQRLPDCHPYLRHGSGFWKDAYWQLMCDLKLRNPPTIRIEDRVANDRFYQFLEATWMWQQLPWAVLFYAWGGLAFVFWGVCARVTAGVFGHWLIGYFAHNKGGMHHEVVGAAVQGRNIPLTSFITMGESFHNNHHAFPGSARLGLHAGEWDPGWWVLMALRAVGLVWRIRTPRDLPYRPELRRLDPSESYSAKGTFLVVPSGPLTMRQIRWLVGPHIEIKGPSESERLELWDDGTRSRGLPALIGAMSMRSRLLALAAIVAAPAALAIENARTALDIE
jgi:stearoyl-CoA desaturase (delta-9 desaturase)